MSPAGICFQPLLAISSTLCQFIFGGNLLWDTETNVSNCLICCITPRDVETQPPSMACKGELLTRND